jgi:hypothetical protein
LPTIDARALASAPVTGSVMHFAVVPPNGSKQSPYTCDDVRACVMQCCTHFPFLGMNRPNVLAVFDPQRNSAGVGMNCASARLGASPMVAAAIMTRTEARNVAIMTAPSPANRP